MATFGYNTIGTAGTDDPADNIIWCKATSTPTGSGTLTLTAIQCYCAILAGAPSVCFALYTDSAGAPNTRVVANETPVSVGASFAWVTQSFNQTITSGTQYWFGIRVPNGQGSVDISVEFDTNGGATEGYFKSGGVPESATFPATVSGASSFTNERWSIYGTYTVTGGPQSGFLVSPMQNTPNLVLHTAARQALPW